MSISLQSGYLPKQTRSKTISSFANSGSKAAGRLSSVYDARYIIVALAAALLLAACGGGGSSGGGSSVAPPLTPEQAAVEFVGQIGQGDKGEMDETGRGILFNINYYGSSGDTKVYFKQKENNIISVSVFASDGLTMEGSGDLKLEFDPAYKVGAFTNLFRLFYQPGSVNREDSAGTDGENYEETANNPAADNPAAEFARGLALPKGSFVVALKEGPRRSFSNHADFVGIHGEEKFDIKRINDDINNDANKGVRKEFINFWQAKVNEEVSYGCGEQDCDKAHSVGYTSKGQNNYKRNDGYYLPGAVPFDDFRMQVKLIKPASLPDRLEEDSSVSPVPQVLVGEDDNYFQLESWYLTDTVNSVKYNDKFGSSWQPSLSFGRLTSGPYNNLDDPNKLFIPHLSHSSSESYFRMRFFENPIDANRPYLAGGYSLITSKGGEAKLAADADAAEPTDADYAAVGEYYWGVFVLEQN